MVSFKRNIIATFALLDCCLNSNQRILGYLVSEFGIAKLEQVVKLCLTTRSSYPSDTRDDKVRVPFIAQSAINETLRQNSFPTTKSYKQYIYDFF